MHVYTMIIFEFLNWTICRKVHTTYHTLCKFNFWIEFTRHTKSIENSFQAVLDSRYIHFMNFQIGSHVYWNDFFGLLWRKYSRSVKCVSVTLQQGPKNQCYQLWLIFYQTLIWRNFPKIAVFKLLFKNQKTQCPCINHHLAYLFILF